MYILGIISILLMTVPLKPFQEFIIDYACQVWNKSRTEVQDKFIDFAEKGKLVFLIIFDG